jgi:hypothetical protein
MGLDFYCRFTVPSPLGGGLGWGEEPVKVSASPLPEGEGTVVVPLPNPCMNVPPRRRGDDGRESIPIFNTL